MEMTSQAFSLLKAKPQLAPQFFGSKKTFPGKLDLAPVDGVRSRCKVISLSSSSSEIQSANGSTQKIDSNSLNSGEYGERIVVGEYVDEDDDEMSMKLECDESGCVLVIGPKLKSLEEEKSEGFLRCDINGCYFEPEKPEQAFKVIEGSGWRLGYETSPESEESFSAMVGSGGWSVALTASEFNDFSKLIQMLRKGIITMGEDGIIGKDEIVMQVERGNVWMECKLPKKRLPSLQKFLKFGGRKESAAFSIRFVVGGKSDRRQAEGQWPAEAVLDMLQKVDECEELSKTQLLALTAESEATKAESALAA